MNLNEKIQNAKSSQKSNGHQPTGNKQQLSTFKSEFVEEYEAVMKSVIIEDLSEIKERLRANDIEMISDYHHNATVKLVELKLDSALIEVCVGYFKMTLKVFRILLKESEVLEGSYIGQGAFACVSALSASGYICAYKSIPVSDSRSLSSLINVYTEYILTKISGIVGVGPRCQLILGYDIVCFSSSAIFTIELCKTSIEIPLNFKVREDLLSGLKILHSLKICHGDIKQDNVAYSYLSKRYIFIDFGLSLIVKEEVGEKSLTSFFGSYKYASPQMKKLYYLATALHIDLFYNDLHCLQFFLQQQKNNIYEIEVGIKTDYIPCQLVSILKIKSFLFNGQTKKALAKIIQEQKLCKTVLKIFIEEFANKSDCLNILKQKVQNNEVNEIDNILNAYFEMLYRGEFDHYFMSIITFIESDMTIDAIWQKNYWMDEITIYLEADPKAKQQFWSEQDFRLRRKLIEKIFIYLRENCKGEKCNLYNRNFAFLFKFRTVLSALFTHHKNRKNIRFLESIRNLFMKIDSCSDQYKVEASLLQLYQKNLSNEITMKKMEYLLFRRLATVNFSYDSKDLFRIDSTTLPQFLNATIFENLYYKLLKYDFDQSNKQQILEISKLFEEQENLPKQEITELFLFFNSIISLQSTKKYASVQSRSIRLALKKVYCYYFVGAFETTHFFAQDLYLSNFKSYFEMFKNMYLLSAEEMKEACNEYFDIYYRHLQFLPFLIEIINTTITAEEQIEVFCFFIDKFISTYQTAILQTSTYAIQSLLLIRKFLMLSFISFKEFLTQNHKRRISDICKECGSVINKKQLSFLFRMLIQHTEILVDYFDGDKQKCSIQIQKLFKKIKAQQLVEIYPFHSIVEMIGVAWHWQTSNQIQIENILIEISEACIQIEDFNAFSQFTNTLLTLQKVFQKRNLCLQQFNFLIKVTTKSQNFVKNNLKFMARKFQLPYHLFVDNYKCEDLLVVVERLVKEGMSLTEQYYHLSGLFMSIYLKIEANISAENRRKILLIIAFGIPKIVWAEKTNLLIPIFYKKHLRQFECKSKRKQTIILKIICKFKHNFRKWVQKLNIGSIRKKIVAERIKAYISALMEICEQKQVQKIEIEPIDKSVSEQPTTTD